MRANAPANDTKATNKTTVATICRESGLWKAVRLLTLSLPDDAVVDVDARHCNMGLLLGKIKPPCRYRRTLISSSILRQSRHPARLRNGMWLLRATRSGGVPLTLKSLQGISGLPVWRCRRPPQCRRDSIAASASPRITSDEATNALEADYAQVFLSSLLE
ncbi:hypothetical protein C8034_v012073 [Colletotrichum sidae]|uniref:Uncharacterized protein n=1 Tax=Colletotrichum sidae TaxID=1347389 RepID=A0A4R8THQ7_9PEZI|nr:hypothetical protein C8034_v012073 [Colletotrichum sidae]